MKKLLLLSFLIFATTSLTIAQTLPTASSDTKAVWHKIIFKNGGAILKDNGIGKRLTTTRIDDNDSSVHWKLVALAASNSYQIVSQSGNCIGWDSTRFVAVAEKNAIPLHLKAETNGQSWEISRTAAATLCMNQWGGSGTGRELGEYNFGDINNGMTFQEQIPLPKVSDDMTVAWYRIRFSNGGGMLQDMGTNLPLQTANAGNYLTQQWKLLDAGDGAYFLVNKLYSYVGWDGQHFIASKKPVALTLKISSNATYPRTWEIGRIGVNGSMSQGSTAGIGKAIAEGSNGDATSPVTFSLTGEATHYQSFTSISSDNSSNLYLLGDVQKIDLTGGSDMTVITKDGKSRSNITKIILAITDKQPTGIEAVDASQLYVYPNAAAHSISIEGLAGNHTVRIYSLGGKIVKQQTTENGKAVIDISALPAGTYLLNAGSQTVKFIKK